MKDLFTLVLVLVMATLSSARRSPNRMFDGIEYSNGYMGWGMSSLDHQYMRDKMNQLEDGAKATERKEKVDIVKPVHRQVPKKVVKKEGDKMSQPMKFLFGVNNRAELEDIMMMNGLE